MLEQKGIEMANNKKKNINTESEAKASASAKKKQPSAKQTKKNDEEWLESEVNSVDLGVEKENDNKSTESNDDLMKKAAEQLEKLQAEVKEWKDNYLRLHAE